ncbi:rhodanese-like domain-containing protein [bacterium]|jgi:rhodanese-related sulfurtransferase|nr:rhodanese-like domain-containing protein [bacterium]
MNLTRHKLFPLFLIIGIFIIGISVIFKSPILSALGLDNKSENEYKILTKKDLRKIIKKGSGYSFITVNEAFIEFNKKNSLFMDARPKKDYNKLHIPGSFFAYPYSDTLNKRISLLNPSDPIIAYCFSKSCPLSENLAKHLVNRGFTNIKILKGGIKEWGLQEYPIEGFIEAYKQSN